MKARVLLVILGTIVLLSGCSGLTNEEILAKTQKKFQEIKTYQCTLEIKVTGNKDSQTYGIKQYYKAKDSYRLVTLSPKHLEGKIVIIDGERAKIIHPHIEKSIIIENFTQNREESKFLGEFLTWNDAEDIEVKEESLQGQEYLLLNKINKEDYYHYKQSIWINKKTMLPKYMKIYDKEETLRIEIDIIDLTLNEKVGEELFKLE